jgi:hypothetical protein
MVKPRKLSLSEDYAIKNSTGYGRLGTGFQNSNLNGLPRNYPIKKEN